MTGQDTTFNKRKDVRMDYTQFLNDVKTRDDYEVQTIARILWH